MFSEAQEVAITGGEFNLAGRDMVTVTTTSSNVDCLTRLEDGHGASRRSQYFDSTEVNNITRDQVKVTVVNVLPNVCSERSTPTNPKEAQPYLGFPLFDIHEMEDDTPDERILTASSTNTTNSSSSSGSGGFLSSGDFGRSGMYSSCQNTTMTSLQDSQSYLESGQTRNECNSACELYMRLMVQKGQGYPLWSPTPSTTLPLVYREAGVSIGDVGLVTSDGAFDFLFNVFLPRAHPINPDDMFYDFEPMPFLNERDIDHRFQFDEGSCLSTGGIHPAFTGPDTPHSHSFQYGGKEGAIVVFPDGAWSTDARNKTSFLQYAAANAEKWYQYANGPRARQTQNNTLYLVTGCVKSKSWGMATIERSTNQTSLPLCLRSENSGYQWRPSGRTSAQAYPKPNHSVYHGGIITNAPNQCNFVRGYRIALQEESWARLFNSPASRMEKLDENDKFKPNDDSPPPAKKRSWVSRLFKKNRKDDDSSNSQQRPRENRSNQVLLSIQTDDRFQPPRGSDSWHPSHTVNQWLLQAYPHGKVALTHDDDWCPFIIQQDHYNSLELNRTTLNEIQRANTIECRNGVLFLEPNVEPECDRSKSDVNSALKSQKFDLQPRGLLDIYFARTRVFVNAVMVAP